MKLEALTATVREAGTIALEIYNKPFAVETKADQSPVTQADLAVDKLLYAAISAAFPDVVIVTEEQAQTHRAIAPDTTFFLVDPIDGTREFINKTGEFTINIALIEQGQPVAGIVFAPVQNRFFIGDLENGAFEIDQSGSHKRLSVRSCTKERLTAIASRSHRTPETQSFLDNYAIIDCVTAGSSLKFCILAAGEADIYPRFGPTMEWDTAAGHAILKAAGGQVLNIDRTPLIYAKPEFRNPDFMACSPDAAQLCPAR